ncbi:type I polyketide synthase [Marinitenerispora sediminis]|uniref:type I polyketide synthase n=1 Tax=Marinitenerispora sediminis TaxID=1931232 RepID=UPI001F2E6F59|nr:type I polyketide synthase [Marinitenerispora sediminis]
MSCRLPAGVDSPEALWEGLLAGRDLVAECDARGRRPGHPPGAAARPAGGWLEGIEDFEPAFFDISPREAAFIDPQIRLAMEVAWEALERAGVPPRGLRGGQTGVYMGMTQLGYMLHTSRARAEVYSATGTMLSGVAGRLSYLLGCHGPSVALDGGCAASLIAVHLACAALQAGETDMALAGGVNITLDEVSTTGLTEAGVLSPTGRCHAFDAAADGFVRSEGCGVVVLKRLADARRDGDRVLAVLRGSAINHVGPSQSIMHPSAAAQRMVIRTALGRAGVRPEDIGLVETHGTGTPTGDPIEFEALSSVYGRSSGGCALGAVKTNVGHTESAAGVIGLIKTVLALRAGIVPPNLHFRTWNPDIGAGAAEGARLFVPTSAAAWPVPGVRRAAVAGLGITGMNAHLVLEQAPDPAEAAALPEPSAARPGVFLVSHVSPGGLGRTAERVARWLEGSGAAAPLADVAHTLAARRSHAPCRAAVVAGDRAELAAGLRALAAGRSADGVLTGQADAAADPVWVFSGHGSQWPGMARELLAAEPAFAEAIAEVGPVARSESGLDLRDVIAAGAPVSRMDVVQPLVFAIQLGLAAVWRARGVRPAAVVGHSMGEAAAAVTSGMLTAEQGMRVVCVRSRLLEKVSGGAMALVPWPRARVEEWLARRRYPGVGVAVVASPGSTVVAGDGDELRRVCADLEGAGVEVQPVAVPVAAHSPSVEPVLAELIDALGDLGAAPAAVPFYSTVLDDPRGAARFDSGYWAANLRRPVEFARATEALLDDGHRIFLEVSPHPLLVGAVEETAAAAGHRVTALPTLLRGRGEAAAVATHLAALHCAGGRIDQRRAFPGRLADVPATTWERRRYWLEAPDHPAPTGAHPLLGGRAEVPVPSAPGGVRLVWRGDVGTAAHPWLADHRVRSVPIFPGAGFLEMILAAGCETFGCAPTGVAVHDVGIERLLALAERVEVFTCAASAGPDACEVEILTRGGDGGWTRHAHGRVRRVAAADRAEPPPLTAPEHAPVTVPREELYRTLAAIGPDYGPAFTGTSGVAASEGGTVFLGRVEVPDAGRHRAGVHLDPALLDVCLQPLLLGLDGGASRGGAPGASGRPWVPERIDGFRLLRDGAPIRWCRTEVVDTDGERGRGRAALFAEDGVPVAVVDEITLARLPRPSAAELLPQRLFEVTWRSTAPPRPAEGATGGYLVVAEPGAADFAAALVEGLAAAGRRAAAVRPGPGLAPDAWAAAVAAGAAEHGSGAGLAGVVVCVQPAVADAEPDRDGALRRVSSCVALVRAHSEGASLPRLWLVTQGGRDVGPDGPADPGQGALRGLVRVLAAEHPELRPCLVDVDGDPDALVAELCADTAEDEVAWRKGERHVARVTRAPLGAAERRPPRTAPRAFGRDGFIAVPDGSGTLGGVRLVDRPRRAPGPGEVEVRVSAVSVNFRDAMLVLGLLPEEAGEDSPIGIDCVGTVTAAGPGVRHVAVGDRVLAMALGMTGSFRLVDAALARRVPDRLGDEEAVTFGVPYLTAWAALRDRARLRPGETVLVHSAASGTGLAAVHVARAAGARVIATAGTEEKRGFLRGLGVRDVLDSRTLDFAPRVREATGGRGVDVLLNSLAGPAMLASLELLAPRGRFVELGKRDLQANTPIGLRALSGNATYSALDLASLIERHPDEAGSWLEAVLAEAESGGLPPLPVRVFPFRRLTEALRVMAAGRHVGRLVVRMPRDGEVRVAPEPGSSPAVRPGGGYVITGGLRGLGLAAARWLAGHGAGRIVLNGRSEPSAEARAAIAELRAAGAEVEVVRGDIADPATAPRLVAAATAAGAALHGVLHSAVVLDDAPVSALDAARVERVWRPKVDGAWQLHLATQGCDLDWFVTFSSMSTLIGNPGQANYAAANAWLDAFAGWRRARGLPALSIAWGPWGETGLAQDFAERGAATISTEEGMAAFEALVAHDRVHTAMGPFEPAVWFRGFSHTAAAPLFSTLVPRGGTGSGGSHGEITAIRAAATGAPRRALLRTHLTGLVAAITNAPRAAIRTSAGFRSLGIDSLMAVEFRNRLRTGLGVEIPVNAIWAHPTVAELAAHLDRYLDRHLDPAAGGTGR